MGTQNFTRGTSIDPLYFFFGVRVITRTHVTAALMTLSTPKKIDYLPKYMPPIKGFCCATVICSSACDEDRLHVSREREK